MTSSLSNTEVEERILRRLLHQLIDQEQARIIVRPNVAASGFWFGGGNLIQDEAGAMWLSGRYRNYGDSRTGLVAGTRGLECALFRSTNQGMTFEKVLSFSKEALSEGGGRILSIEGTALYRRVDGTWDLYISLEKERPYPAGYEMYQKPGTGVWSIDRLSGSSLSDLSIKTREAVLSS